MRAVVSILGLAACGFEIPATTDAAAVASDGPADAPLDTIDADLTPQTRVFREGLDGYTGTLDSYISNNVPGPHGAETVFIWDLVADEEHGLLRFTSIFGAGPGQIPPGATIVSAELRLVVVDPTANIGTMRDVAIDWNEATTWATFGPAAGVQASDLGLSTRASPTTGTAIIDVATYLAAWSASPASNFGWLFSPGGADGCDVGSSEAATAEDRPTLRVVYIPPVL